MTFTKDEIDSMAKEAGFPFNKYGLLQGDDEGEIDADAMFARFTQLIAAKEREECALACEEISLQAATSWKLAYQPQDQGREMGADDCAASIRARGQKGAQP